MYSCGGVELILVRSVYVFSFSVQFMCSVLVFSFGQLLYFKLRAGRGCSGHT